MRARVRSVRDRLLGPVLTRLDAMEASVDARLDELAERVRSLESAVQMVEGRSATAVERAVGATETAVRLAHRLERIEQAVPGPPDAGE